MKISWNWLSSLVDTTGLEPQSIADLLSLSGLEVEGVESFGVDPGLDKVVVAKIESMEKHPDADKLAVCMVDAGEGELRQIVCGAKNMKVGDKVPAALPGAVLPPDKPGEKPFKIKKSKLRGVPSLGMLCGSDELGLGVDEDGLMLLPDDLEIGQPVLKALDVADTVFDVSVTPNRPDALSHLGVARDVAALTGRKLLWPSLAAQWREASRVGQSGEIELPWSVDANAPAVESLLKVDLRDAQGCPRYGAAVVSDLKVGPSPRWMRNRLMAVGQRPINNLVDVTNYINMECGQPLHAFDLDKLKGGALIIRKANAQEKIQTLDGQEHTLGPEDVVIADAEGAVAVAGAMGGAGSEVSEETTRIAIECAHFHAMHVRKTARKLKIHTESSHRFERGVDPAGVPYFLRRAVELVLATQAELGQTATVAQGFLDAYPTPIEPSTVLLDPAHYARLIGATLSAERIAQVLDSLDLVSVLNDGVLHVQVPTFRPDISRPVDLIEEVARVEGFDKLEPKMPVGTMGFAHSQRENGGDLPDTLWSLEHEQTQRHAREYLLSQGLFEAVNYSFVGANEIEALGFAADDVRGTPIVVRNPLSEQLGVMRTTLLPGLLKNLSYNRAHQRQGANLFELGRVYLRDDMPQAPLPASVGGPRWVGHAEPTHLAALFADPMAEHFTGTRRWDLHDLRTLAQSLVTTLSRRALTLESLEGSAPGMLHPYASASILVDGVSVGWLGALHPDVLSGLKLKGEAFAMELDVSRLLTLRQSMATMRAIPRFPASQRDYALVVDAGLPFSRVDAAMDSFGDARLAEYRLFDLYEGEQVGEGRKSIAIKVAFRDPQETLSEEVLASLHKKLVAHLEETLQAELR